MAKIPEFTGRAKIAQQDVAPRVSPGFLTGSGKSLSEVGDALLKIEERVSEVRKINQVSSATVEHSKEIRGIQATALQDPDLDENLPTYLDQIRKSGSRHGSTIQDSIARTRFDARTALSTTALEFDLGKEARRTMSTKAKANLDNVLNERRESFYAAPNETIRQEILQQTEDEIQEYMDAGLITNKEGNSLIDEMNDDMRRFAIEREIDFFPEAALEKLKKGESGIRDADLKQDLEEKAEKKIESNLALGKKLITDAHDQNEINYLVQHYDGKSSLTSLYELDTKAEVRPAFAEAMENNHLSAIRHQTQVSDDAEYMDLLKKTLVKKRAGKDTEQLMIDIIDANTEGLLTNDDARYLSSKIAGSYQNAAAAHRDGLIDKMGMGVVELWNKTLGDGNPRTEREISIDILRKFENDEAVSPEEITKTVRELINQKIIEQRPELATATEDVTAIADESGLTELRDDKLAAELTKRKADAEAKGLIYVLEKATGLYGPIPPDEMNEELFEAV